MLFDSVSVTSSFSQMLLRYCHKNDLTPFTSPIGESEDGEPLSWLAISDLENFINSIQDQQPHIPAIGVALGEFCELADCGLIGYLSLSSRNLFEVMTRLLRHQNMVYNGNTPQVELEMAGITISWGTERYTPTCNQEDILICSFITIFRRLLGKKNFSPVRIDLIRRLSSQKNRAYYEDFFGCEVNFGAERTLITIPANVMLIPLPSADSQQVIRKQQQEQALKAALPIEGEFYDKFREALIMAIHNGHPKVDDLAVILGTDARQLQRRLDDVNFLYSKILYKARFELCKNYMLDPDLSLSDIAFLLGYAEHKAFKSAFRMWAKESYSDYRSRVLGQKKP